MSLLTIIRISFRSLFANGMRSALAVLGIVIGVSSVIALLMLGTAAQNMVLNRMSSLGTNLIVISPSASGTGGVTSGTLQNLTIEDAKALVGQVPGVRFVSPVVSGPAQVKYLSSNSRVNVVGVAPTYLSIRNFEVERGRCFNDSECDRLSRVAIIGPTASLDLFGTSDPLGKAVKINGVNFSVIGVTKSKGDQGWFNPDNQLFVPYLVAMKQLFGVEKLKEIDVQTFDDADATQVQASITQVLRRRHKLSPEVENDFNVRTQAEILETAGSFTDTFRLLLSGIGSISLLVGGIGIMNIMLVSVKERTREIGIRKAIGAKDRDILGQFLVEAVVLSGTGGAMGVVLGVVGAFLIGKVTSFSITIDYSAIVLSLATATCIGIFFGYYPALRAANLNPIDALRYE